MSSTGGAFGAFAGISAVNSIGTGYANYEATKAAAKYKSAQAKTNAAMADVSGQQALEAGDLAAGRKNTQVKQIVGSDLAIQGRSGVDVNSGSSLMVRHGTDLVGRMDELTLKNNAMRAAFGYKIQAFSDRSGAQMDELTGKSQANQSLISGGIQAISAPLGIYTNYLMLSRRSGMGGDSTIPDSYTNGSGSGSTYMPGAN